MTETESEDLDYLKKIEDPLLAWYHKNRRILPWREEPTPYRVWVSEIMLQQTRVEAGRAYFERFMTVLPDVESLANVEDQLLMKLWEGLGYYNRARNLKKAAGIVMERYGGRIPTSYEELLSLPGIGPYTAGAIASIAFGIAMPAVDGNVLRVISRIMARRADIAQDSVKKSMEKEIREIMPKEKPGDFNQALMELGAIMCLPNGAPRCAQCPMEGICKGALEGIAAELPVKKAKKERRIEEKTILLLIDEQGRLALHKRPAKGLLSGMWELPSAEGHLGSKEVRELLEAKGICCDEPKSLPDAKHIFSHIEWRMKGYQVAVKIPNSRTSLKKSDAFDLRTTGVSGSRTTDVSGLRTTGMSGSRTTDASGLRSADEWDLKRLGNLTVGENPNVYLKDVEDRRAKEEGKLLFVNAGELADIYALPSAFKGFQDYFPK